MKLVSILLVSTAAFMSVEAKIPGYVRLCKRNDPLINKCIENSILSLRDKLAEGIPELDVPSLDPLFLDKLILNLGPGLKAEARSLKVVGARNFRIENFVADLDADTFKLKILFPEVTIRGKYDLDATLGTLPLKGNGPISIVAKSISGQGTLHGKRVVKGGKTLFYFPSMELKMVIGDYHVKLENLFEGDPAIGEATNKLLNEEKTEVLNSLLPGLEKAVIEQLLLVGNNICKHFTWDELFPES